MKKLICILTAIAITLALCACSGGISGDEAKDYVEDFFDAVEEAAEDGDFEIAESFLHPDCPAEIEAFVEAVSEDKGVDFSSIEIVKYTGFSASYYDSRVDGSRYGLSMQLSISGESAKAEIELVNNDKGYGIYNFNIKFE